MKKLNLIAAAGLVIAGSTASAATIELVGGTAEAIGGIPGQDFIPELTAAGATHLYSGPLSLITDGAVKVTFSWVGSESGFVNSLLLDGTTIITEDRNVGAGTDFATNVVRGETFTTNFAGGDLAELLTFEAFDVGAGSTISFDANDHEFGIFADSANTTAMTVFYVALDDNGANVDDNHDDIIVRVEIAAVPLPATGLLLIAGLGGLFGARRFRKTA